MKIDIFPHIMPRKFYDTMVNAKVVPEGLDIKKAYTLDFVNKGVGLDLKK